MGEGHLEQMESYIKTGKIQAYRYLEGKEANGQLFIDWAVSLLGEGNDSPALRILAGFMPEDNSIFEVESYVQKSLEELGIPILDEGDAIMAYAYEVLSGMVKNEIGKEEVLKELAAICIEKGYPRELWDFYLLHFALDDLSAYPFAPYWEGATRENIDQIIFQTARDWLEKYQNHQVR